MSSCKDVVDLALEYIRDELPVAEKAALDSHLSHCPSCINFMKTYEFVPNLTKSALSRQMPESVKSSLLQFLSRETRRAS